MARRTASGVPADQDLPLGFADAENQATETSNSQEVCPKQRPFQSFCKTLWGGEGNAAFTQHCFLDRALCQALWRPRCHSASLQRPRRVLVFGPGVGMGWGNLGPEPGSHTDGVGHQESDGVCGPEMLTLPPQPVDLSMVFTGDPPFMSPLETLNS